MMRWFVMILLVGFSSAQAAVDLTPAKAMIYEAGMGHEKPLFHYTRTVIPLTNGNVRAETQFTTMDGTLAYSETVESKGDEIVRYEWNHHQMGESGEVEIRDGKAYYTYKKGGKTRKDTAEAADNLVIGPTMIAYAQSHWKELRNGSSVSVRIGVPDRLNDYGFRFRKEKDPIVENSGNVRVSLQPTSFFVSLAVKPIDFIFSKDGSRLVRTTGMSLLKVKKDGKWADLVADTEFE